MGAAPCEEIALILKDFEKDHRMLRDMKKSYDEKEEQMGPLMDLFHSDIR